MNRSEILKRADEIINGERQDSYGKPENNFAMIANLWTAYLGCVVTAHDVAMMMTLFKVARCKTGVGTEDSYVDACGYLAIGGEMEMKRVKMRDKMLSLFPGENEQRFIHALYGDPEPAENLSGENETDNTDSKEDDDEEDDDIVMMEADIDDVSLTYYQYGGIDIIYNGACDPETPCTFFEDSVCDAWQDIAKAINKAKSPNTKRVLGEIRNALNVFIDRLNANGYSVCPSTEVLYHRDIDGIILNYLANGCVTVADRTDPKNRRGDMIYESAGSAYKHYAKIYDITKSARFQKILHALGQFILELTCNGFYDEDEGDEGDD